MGGARDGGLFIKCDADRRGPIHYRQMIAAASARSVRRRARPRRGETNLSLSLFLHRTRRSRTFLHRRRTFILSYCTYIRTRDIYIYAMRVHTRLTRCNVYNNILLRIARFRERVIYADE